MGEAAQPNALFQALADTLSDCCALYAAVRDDSGGISDFIITYANDELRASSQRSEADGPVCGSLLAHRESGLFEAFCRVLETGEFRRVGGNKGQHCEARILAATAFAATRPGLVYAISAFQNPTGYSQVLAEYSAINGTPSKIYHYGLDLISQHGTAIYYFGYDGSGSTRFLLNSSGSIASTYDYDAFGDLTPARRLSGNRADQSVVTPAEVLGEVRLDRAPHVHDVLGVLEAVALVVGDEVPDGDSAGAE